jgi:hypothetical protein
MLLEVDQDQHYLEINQHYFETKQVYKLHQHYLFRNEVHFQKTQFRSYKLQINEIEPNPPLSILLQPAWDLPSKPKVKS